MFSSFHICVYKGFTMMMMPQRNRLSFKKLSKTDFSQHVATTTMHIMMHVSDKSFETKQGEIGSISEADCFISFTTECDIQVLGIFHFFWWYRKKTVPETSLGTGFVKNWYQNRFLLPKFRNFEDL